MAGRVPFLSYDQMAKIASDFLQRFDYENSPPIDIELVLESSGLVLVPMKNLFRNYGIDGFLSADLKHIYVDEHQYMHSMSLRFRFTLAHEIAHSIAHRSLLTTLGVKEPADADGGLRGLSQPEYDAMEFQANMIGGMILVPEVDLIQQVRQIIGLLGQFDSIDEKIDQAAILLCRRYKVSKDVVAIRIKYEEII